MGLGAVIRRWRQRMEQGRRERLLADIERCQGWMAAILFEARQLGAPETVDAATAISFWRSWRVKVAAWVEESEL
jgi:hypothetical protein